MQNINLPRLNRIWDGIQSGQLEHVQDTYHCGTAHCIAGWEVHFLSQEHGVYRQETQGGSTPTEQILELSEILGLNLHNSADDADLAAASLGLNSNETIILFDIEASVNVQSALVAYLNTGKRLPLDFSDVDYNDNKSLVLKGSAAVWKDFTDFLQFKNVNYTLHIINYANL